ncbi:MAG: hypothetical protein IJN54_13370 [Lachnospiraceae bacterium]|nr:hypothetical protein [Lachnospiraceae bacterium]
MAKKFGKFLLVSAAIGAVAAGAYYYLQNKNMVPDNDFDDDDDFDDFSEDLDNENSDSSERSYVSLDFDTTETSDEDTSSETNSSEDTTAKEALSNLEKAAESAKTEVEEFFDEDDEDLSVDE